MEEKNKLDIIEGINVPCSACKDTETKSCEYCPYWQFAQLAYLKMKINPIETVGKILRMDSDDEVKPEPKKRNSFFSFFNF